MLPRTFAAWSVHAFTATGAVLSLLSLTAVMRQDWPAALGWMLGAMLVDSVDGFLARAVGVRTVLPGFDGALLDNIVDYLGYVVVPAVIVLRAGLVPAGTETIAAAGMLLASAYQFCQRDAKTEDHFFKGFPSFWNIAVLYLFFLPTPAEGNLALLALLALGAFVPARWAYPSRMSRLRGITLALTGLWGVSLAGLVLTYPDPPSWLLGVSLSYVVYYVGASLWLS